MSEQYLTAADLAKEVGVTSGTVYGWRSLSRPGRRYADHPFPAPDAMFGQTSVWSAERLPEIRAWMAGRPGEGFGGGRPRKRTEPK